MTGAPHPVMGRWRTPLAFAAGFLVLGLVTLDFYGVSWDEPLHREWGRILWAYLRTGDSALLSQLAGGAQYYGPLFYLLTYGVSELAHGALGMHFGAANHLVTLLTASLGVLCTYLLAETLTTRAAALGATTLLCLLPPFLAHAHYNPKDIPLLTLVTAAALFAAKAHRSRRTRDAVLAGAFLGWAIATKPTALVMVPVLGGAVAADLLLARSYGLRTAVRLVATTAVAAGVSLVVVWPTLWREPSLLLGSIRYFGSGRFWEGTVLYFGQLFPAVGLPWHYAPVMLLMAIPLVTLALAAVGLVLLARRILRRDRVFEGTMLFLWIGLTLLLFTRPGLARYDGMRQLFFVVPAIMTVAGAGWAAFWRVGNGSPRRRVLVVGASVIAAGWLALENARVFPYGGSYVNAAARMALGPHLERRFEPEYWGVTYREGMRWLQQSAEPNAVVCAPVASGILPWHQVLLWQRETSRADLTYDCARDARYVMLMTRFAEWPAEYRRLTALRPVFTISRLGSDLLYIYEVR
jgi:4-amino-4-deoxy-L-arabinose transferase-like glycosyltransferase